jgi:serine/threonine protein kinase
MLTGRFPFGEVDQTKIAKYIKKMRSVRSFELRKSEERFLYFEQDYLDIVRGLLSFKPDSRLSVSKALSLEYFTQGMNIEDIEKEIDDDFDSIFNDL